MARFRGTVQGNRSEASRLGHQLSGGVRVTSNGWDSGISARSFADMGADIHNVWATGGSNGNKPTRLIASISDASGSPVVTLYRKDGKVAATWAV